MTIPYGAETSNPTHELPWKRGKPCTYDVVGNRPLVFRRGQNSPEVTCALFTEPLVFLVVRVSCYTATAISCTSFRAVESSVRRREGADCIAHSYEKSRNKVLTAAVTTLNLKLPGLEPFYHVFPTFYSILRNDSTHYHVSTFELTLRNLPVII